jgi:spore coat-associated protein N
LNKQIALSAVSIFAALALMGGAAYAFFSDTATSTGNTFSSGTLAIQLDDENEAGPLDTVTASIGTGVSAPLVPGGTVSGFISMHNSGTINIAEVKLSATQTTPSTPDLAGVLSITSAVIASDSTCTTGNFDITSSFTTLAALNSTGVDMPNSSLAVNETKYLCLTLTMDSNANNDYQGKTIVETFTFEGHQDTTQ